MSFEDPAGDINLQNSTIPCAEIIQALLPQSYHTAWLKIHYLHEFCTLMVFSIEFCPERNLVP